MRFLPTVAVLFILAVTSVAIVVSEPSDADVQTPQEMYSDADMIITDGTKKNTVNIYTRNGYDEEGQPIFVTSVESYGSDIRALTWSKCEDSAYIVMTGGSIGKLTLLYIDRVMMPEMPIRVKFDMLGGEATSILGMSLSTTVSGYSQSFFDAYCPISSMELNVNANIGELSPVNGLVEIEKLDIRIGSDASVNRLYPTGNGARILNVAVSVDGGKIGYMSNQSSVVNYLTYDLNIGSVDYLCLGADTEGGIGYRLSDFWTFYVCRDVNINISPTMKVGRTIAGAGILDAPNLLCNGERPATGQVRNVIIAGNSTEVYSRTCFVTSNGQALRFSSYQIGGSPVTGSMHSNYVSTYFQNLPVYGDNGIWSTFNGVSIPQLTVGYVATNLTIPNGCTVRVEPGGTLVNSSMINMQGELVNKGTLRNDGVIVQDLGSTVEGNVTGEGLIAYGIEARPNEGKIDVMSTSENAIVLKGTDGNIAFSQMSVRFPGIGAVVEMNTVSGKEIACSLMVVSVRPAEHGAYNAGWNLFIEGVNASDLSGLSVTMSVSVPIQQGYIGQIFDSNSEEMDVTDQSETGLTFVPNGNGLYFFRSIPTDETAEAEHDRLVLNTAIAIAIVFFASIALVYLLRKR